MLTGAVLRDFIYDATPSTSVAEPSSFVDQCVTEWESTRTKRIQTQACVFPCCPVFLPLTCSHWSPAFLIWLWMFPSVPLSTLLLLLLLVFTEKPSDREDLSGWVVYDRGQLHPRKEGLRLGRRRWGWRRRHVHLQSEDPPLTIHETVFKMAVKNTATFSNLFTLCKSNCCIQLVER